MTTTPAWTPFECSFVLGRKVRTWTRFAPSREEALRSFVEALREEHPTASPVAVVPVSSQVEP